MAATRSCLFDPAQLLPAVEEWVGSLDVKRCYDLVMLYSGRGGDGAAAMARESGAAAATLDTDHGQEEDITSVAGCMYAAWLVKSGKDRGLLWLCP